MKNKRGKRGTFESSCLKKESDQSVQRKTVNTLITNNFTVRNQIKLV